MTPAMHSTHQLHLRHHLKDPGALSLRSWARHTETLLNDTALVRESRQEVRRMRGLAHELNCVRSASPELEGPALASAVLRHDRVLHSVEVAYSAELRDHLKTLSLIQARLTPHRLMHMAYEELAGRRLDYLDGTAQADSAMDSIGGSMPLQATDQAVASLKVLRQCWRSMHDTLQALLILVIELHDESLAPFVRRWFDRCVDVLQQYREEMDALQSRIDAHRWLDSGK